MKHVHKFNSQIEPYDPKKVANSVYKTLVSNQIDPQKAKQISQSIAKDITIWITKKTEITHLDVRKQVAINLAKYDKNIAILYEKHKDLW
jgi:transcriptional regulator NrdR family protein